MYMYMCICYSVNNDSYISFHTCDLQLLEVNSTAHMHSYLVSAFYASFATATIRIGFFCTLNLDSGSLLTAVLPCIPVISWSA